jgi:hypothetical protein
MKRIALAMLPAFWLVSCGNDSSAGSSSAGSTSSVSSSTPVHKTLEERCNEKVGFVQDSKGTWKPRVDRRSSFETAGESSYFKGNYKTKECRTPTLEKKSWWGGKDYTTKAFGGKTDGSHFQKTASADGVRSREDGTVSKAASKSVKTNSYKTGAASEAGRGEIDRPSNAQTESSNRNFVQPAIIDWKQQRAMSLDETKSILGR